MKTVKGIYVTRVVVAVLMICYMTGISSRAWLPSPDPGPWPMDSALVNWILLPRVPRYLTFAESLSGFLCYHLPVIGMHFTWKFASQVFWIESSLGAKILSSPTSRPVNS